MLEAGLFVLVALVWARALGWLEFQGPQRTEIKRTEVV